MRKLTMSLESLEITSFEVTAEVRDARGTVLGQAQSVEGCTIGGPPCRFTNQPGCVPITGPCTGPECDITLALSCVECGSDLAVC